MGMAVSYCFKEKEIESFFLSAASVSNSIWMIHTGNYWGVKKESELDYKWKAKKSRFEKTGF